MFQCCPTRSSVYCPCVKAVRLFGSTCKVAPIENRTLSSSRQLHRAVRSPQAQYRPKAPAGLTPTSTIQAKAAGAVGCCAATQQYNRFSSGFGSRRRPMRRCKTRDSTRAEPGRLRSSEWWTSAQQRVFAVSGVAVAVGASKVGARCCAARVLISNANMKQLVFGLIS